MTTTSPIQTLETQASYAWLPVCSIDDLVENSGICALVENKQIAIFTLKSQQGDTSFYACDNYDPFGKANVLSRGILCSISGEVSVCSPLYKQHFSLLTGKCIESEDTFINVYDVKVVGKELLISIPLAQG